jgi:hypothetical protein
MSEKPISPLRQRMIEDMSVRNFVEKTRNDHIRQVKTFTAFLGRSPDTAVPEDLRRFQLQCSKKRAATKPSNVRWSCGGGSTSRRFVGKSRHDFTREAA